VRISSILHVYEQLTATFAECIHAFMQRFVHWVAWSKNLFGAHKKTDRQTHTPTFA